MIRLLIVFELVLLAIVGIDLIAGDGVEVGRVEPAPAATTAPLDAAGGSPTPGDDPLHGVGIEPAEPRRSFEPWIVGLAAAAGLDERDRAAIVPELLGVVVDEPVRPDEVEGYAAMITAAGGGSSGAAGDSPAETPVGSAEASSAAAEAGSESSAKASLAAPPPLVQPGAAFSDPASPSPGKTAPVTPSPQVAEAQRLLSRVGYAPGPADGIAGERTRAAIRTFQAKKGRTVDGEVSPTLLADLQRSAAQAARARTSEPKRPAVAEVRRTEDAPGVLGAIASGFQRLVGQDFDSVRRPAAVQGHCGRHPDAWIWDEGRRAMVHCGSMLAQRPARERL